MIADLAKVLAGGSAASVLGGNNNNNNSKPTTNVASFASNSTENARPTKLYSATPTSSAVSIDSELKVINSAPNAVQVNVKVGYCCFILLLHNFRF